MIALLLALTQVTNTRVAWLGCNRLDAKDWESQKAENPSSANLVQLRQSLSDLDNLSPRPSVVFIAGDFVNGYADDDGTTLREQLAAWKEEVLKSSLSRHAKIIVVPGNHEVNKKVGDNRMPNWETTPIWNTWLKSSPFWDGVVPGPTPDNDVADELADDQSLLNGTLTVGVAKFILVNTDCNKKSQKEKPEVGLVATSWVASQLGIAQADQSVKAIFAIGHKNLLQNGVGDAPVAEKDAKVLQTSMEGTAKFKGFLCSHVHAWHKHSFGDAKWQIIEGRGGSKLEKDWKPEEGRTFGFTVLDIANDGQTTATRFDRPVPTGNYFDGPATPAKPSVSWKL
ncbi:MAG: metallophosphoesterase family protein [Armatimonadota bacterium]